MTFHVGDKLESLRGECVVVSINSGGKNYPIEILYDNDDIDWVTPDGKDGKCHKHPYVWYRDTGSPPVMGEEPEREPWVPEGLTPCWVWNDDDDDKSKALVFYYNEYCSCPYGVILEDCYVAEYMYAEPLPADEIPDWVKF